MTLEESMGSGLDENAQASAAGSNFRLGHGFNDYELARLRDVAVERGVRRFGHVYRSGDAFRSLYVLAFGQMKRVTLSTDGREHVLGLDFPGDLLGFEGIDSGVHSCDVVALQDSSVWGISYTRLADLTREFPTLGRSLHRAMSRQIVLGNQLMLLLGSMRARERVAILLLMFVQRTRAGDTDTCEFDLKITRQEIGNFLGLRLETVSRELTKLTGMGLLRLSRSKVEVLNVNRLADLVGRNPFDRTCAGK
jgi:CRP/FNR family transcriptional regulator, anaerobic regulatory protein